MNPMLPVAPAARAATPARAGSASPGANDHGQGEDAGGFALALGDACSAAKASAAIRPANKSAAPKEAANAGTRPAKSASPADNKAPESTTPPA